MRSLFSNAGVLAAALALICSSLLESTNAAVVKQELVITEDTVAPDCVARPGFVVNGQIPGPTITVNAGDDLHVTVRNQLSNHSISVHMHGLHQRGTPFYDGAAGISQDAIPAGESIELKIHIGENESGTHMYHAHHGFLEQSIFGALLVKGNDESQLEYDDERVIMLSDWWHTPEPTQEAGILDRNFTWIGDASSLLTNGKAISTKCSGRQPSSTIQTPAVEETADLRLFNDSTVFAVTNVAPTPIECQQECGGMAVTEVTAGKRYRFRVINAGTLGYFGFAIASHKMTIVEVDGTLVEPLEVNHLEVNAGQRYSVIVNADQVPGDYFQNMEVRWRPSGPKNGQSILRYTGATEGTQLDPMAPVTDNSTLPVIPPEDPLWVLPDLKPVGKNISPPPSANRTINLTGVQVKIDGFLKWAINTTAFQVPEKAMLRSAYDKTLHRLPEKSSPMKLSSGEVVDVVLGNAAGLNGICEEHPWHLHGHSFWVIARGEGAYGSSNTTYEETENPVLIDTVTAYPSAGAYFQPPLPPGTPCGWVKVRFVADNSGMWPFHCHIVAHFAMGMAVVFDEATEELPPLPPGYPVWADKLYVTSASSRSIIQPLIFKLVAYAIYFLQVMFNALT